METDHELGAWSGDSENLFKCQYPIHHACRNGDFETLTNLLTTADSLNFYEEDGFYGWTPIHWAAHFGKLSCIMRLVEYGASFDATTRRFNQTPVHLAAVSGKGHCLKWLLQCGALINRQLACLRKMMILGGVGCDGLTSRFRQTPLHLSSHSGHPHCVQWLVQSGANINSQDYLGETPIHKAARTGSMECVSLLVSQGAKLSVRNHNGHTASQVAADCGHQECAMYIQRATDIQDHAQDTEQPIISHSLQNGLPQAPPMTHPPSNQHQGISTCMHGNHLIPPHGAISQMQQPTTTSNIHNGMSQLHDDIGMDTCDVGPGGDAGGYNAVQCQTFGLKRSRDDEMEDESMKKLRKADPLWNENNDIVQKQRQGLAHPPMQEVPAGPTVPGINLVQASTPIYSIDPNEMPIKCMMEPDNWNSWTHPSVTTHPFPQDNGLIPHPQNNGLIHDNTVESQQNKSVNNNNYDGIIHASHLISSSTIEHQNTISAQTGYDSLLEAAILEYHGN